MAINKVEYGGNTLIDLTSDSVTPESLLPGVTAHDKSGNQITGTFDSDKYLEKTGDASNATVTFTQATNRSNISSKEKFSVIMGKIAKFFSDLKTVAFTGKYSDLSGTPGVVSKTANGLCPKNGGTTTKFLRDDGTYAEPTASVSGLSTLEQVTAAATAGNVTDPVGAGAVNELNSSLQDSNTSESFNFGVKNGVYGFYTDPARADDSFIPFSGSGTIKIGYQYQVCVRYHLNGSWNNYMPEQSIIKGTITIVLENGVVKSKTNSGGTGIAKYSVSIGDEWTGATTAFSITSITWTPATK